MKDKNQWTQLKKSTRISHEVSQRDLPGDNWSCNSC